MCWCWLILAVGAPVPLARASSDVQTDWAGGGGLTGPVPEWGTCFSAGEDVAWRPIPGQITLSSTPLANFDAHPVELNYGSNDLQAADLDGDTDLDLVGAFLSGAGSVVWWRNDGGPAEDWTRFGIDPAFAGARGVRAADFDGDGRCDVAGTGFSNETAIWWNRGGDPIAWEKQVVSAEFLGGHRLVAADFDANGRLDLAGAAALGDAVVIWLNLGGEPVQWEEQILSNAFTGAVDLHAADIDRDGDPDVVACAYFGHRVSWWRNDGGEPIVWQEQTIAEGFTGAHCVRADDIDGDGDLDVVGVAYDARDVAWWRNDSGDPVTWTYHAINLNYLGVASVRVADLDGDGDADVVASAQDPGRLSWWENADGLGTAWAMRDIRPYYHGAWPLDVADLNEDGLLDVVCGSYYDRVIQWWSVTQFRSGGWMESSILDVGETPDVYRLDWDADLPAGTTLTFRCRASEDPQNLGDWSGAIAQPGFVTGLSGRYMQYRVEFASGDSAVAPILREVCLEGRPASSAPDLHPDQDHALRSLVTSPSLSPHALVLQIPREADLTLELYGPLGRRVSGPWRMRLPAGIHHLPLGALTPGVYFYRVQGAGMSTGGQFVCVR